MLVKGVPIGMLTWFGTFEHVYIFYLEPQTYDENQIQILIVKYIEPKLKFESLIQIVFVLFKWNIS